jgi:hypothetical protein
VKNWSIAGSWVGEYSLDPHPALLPEHFASASFTLLAWEQPDGSFYGTIRDDPVKGIPEEAVVSGWIADEFEVSFSKRYPRLYCGRQTLADQLKQKHQGVLLDPEPSHIVYYRGRYDAETQVMTGAWEIPVVEALFGCQGRLRKIRFGGNTGRWSARRAGGENRVTGEAPKGAEKETFITVKGLFTPYRPR